MSTGLNSMTGVIMEDLIRPMCKEPLSEQKASTIMKIIVVIIGSICVAMVFIVEKMGTLVQAARSISSITAGPLLGIFSLGMIFPWANAKGTLVGGFCGLAIVAWMSLGTQMEIAKGNIRFPHKPISIEGCDETIRNITVIINPINEETFFLYRLSYMYYTIVGSTTVIVIGLIVSYWSGPNDPKIMSKDLFTPVIHKFLPISAPVTNNINNELKPRTRND